MSNINLRNILKGSALFLFFVFSCAFRQPNNSILMRDEIEALKDHIVDLRQVATDLDIRQSSLETRMAVLHEEVGEIKGTIPVKNAYSEIPNDDSLSDISDSQEVLSAHSNEENYEQILEELDKLPPALIYKRAYDYVITGSYFKAVTVLRYFIEKFPAHELSDNAHYWMGECYYAVKDYPNALTEFRKTVDMKGNKVGDALLKIGLTQAVSGEKEKAFATLKQVINKFPNTWLERLAKDKLKKIDNE